jgi:hypothetical protein
MASSTWRAKRLAICVGILASMWAGAASAQIQPSQLQPGYFRNQTMPLGPQIPVQGDWVEVVTVTSKWLVVQNQSGQQFPMALDSISGFIIRWPIDPSRVSPNSLVEAIGLDLHTNQIQTDHVDVFEGGARGLVRPMVQSMIGFNGRPAPYDFLNPNSYASPIPIPTGEDQVPNRVHVVGSVLGMNPLRLEIPGNNSVVIVPSPTGLVFQQVTAGSMSFLKPRDLLYIVPTDAAPKSLIVAQLIAYKAMPLSEFVP